MPKKKRKSSFFGGGGEEGGAPPSSKRQTLGLPLLRRQDAASPVETDAATAAAEASGSSQQGQQSPLQWITADENGNYVQQPEAKEFLKSLRGPISVVSVVGNYRTGKSFLLNKLLDAKKDERFEMSGTTQSCTKGLWLLRRTLESDTAGTVLVCDTEGLGSMSATESHDLRVFSLAMLLSSLFIYNQTGPITEHALNQMSLVAEVSEHVRISSKEGAASEEDLSVHFPRFLLLARDFTLKKVDPETGIEVDSTTYLNLALKIRGSADSSKNRVRSSINKLFPISKRECVTMVRPCNEEDLQHLPELPDEKLRPEFLHSLREIKKIIRQQATPLTHGDMQITGPQLCHLADLFIDSINSGAVPTIADSWSMVSEHECNAAAADARKLFASLLEEARSMKEIRQANSFLKGSIRKARERFLSRAVGDAAAPMGEELVAELKQQAEVCLSEIKMWVQKRLHDEIAELEKRATRECTSVESVVKVFQLAEENVEGDATKAIWYSEAFDALSRSITAVTYRVEKQKNELFLDLEKTKLELSKAETKYSAEIASLHRQVEDAEREHTALIDRAESAENALMDARRQYETLEIQAKNEREENHTRMAELQHQMQTIDMEAEQRGKANAEDNSEELTQLTVKLTQKDVIIAQLTDESQDVQLRLSALNKENKELQDSLIEIPSLRSKLEEAVLKAEQYEITAKAATEQVEQLQSKHEEESVSIQKEAMETVNAMKSLLHAEREKHKANKSKYEGSIRSLEEQLSHKEEVFNNSMKEVEERLSKREMEVNQLKRASKQKEESLRSEIERYSTLFKEQQQGLDRHRKETTDQLREARAEARLMANDHKERAKESEAKRRDLEMEMASLRARFDASERRKSSLEDELARSRELLTKNKKSSVEITRLTQELSVANQQKDAAEANLKAARVATDAALKSEAEVRKKCDAEMTKMSMRYERQISVLESRLLE